MSSTILFRLLNFYYMENNLIKVFGYEGNDITFRTDNGILMVNATEMAKHFGKRSSDFVLAKQTKEIISCVSAETGIPATDLVIVNQGGSNQGTWMHEEVALIFAQWLSPKFYLWCNAKIKELLLTGTTSITKVNTLPNFSNPAEAARAWADQFEARQLAEKKVELQQPKVEFYDTVIISESTIDMAAVAKVLNMGIGRNNLFKLLRESLILRSNNEPYQKYIDMGWFKVVETPFNMPDGKVRVGLKTVVFQKGLDEIRKFLIKSGYAA